MNKKIISVALAFACACLWGCAGTENSDFVVCQFNMRNNGDKNDGRIVKREKNAKGKKIEIRDGSEKWSIRAPLIAEFLKYNEVDICGSQELVKVQVDDLSKLLGDGYARIGNPVNPARPHSTNNVIYYRQSRFELLDSGSFWFSETPDVPGTKSWDCSSCIRNTNWAKFKDRKSGKVFFIFNSHFDHIGKVARIKAAEILVSKVKEIAGDYPFFTMGDYNSNINSVAIKVIKDSGFMKHAREVCETPPYGPKFTDNYGYVGTGKDWREWIDYIFVSDSVRILKFAVLTDCINGVYLSDHFPLIVKAKIK